MNNRIMAMLFALVAAMFISIVPVKAEAAECEHPAPTVQTIAAKPATCNTEGNTAYYKCGVCHRAFEDFNCTKRILDLDTTVISAKGHKWQWTSNETQHFKKCSVEGCTAKEGAENHTLSKTDNGDGTHDIKCTFKDCTYAVLNQAHDDGTAKDCVCGVCRASMHALELKDEVPATCEKAGTKAHYACKNCVAKFDKELTKQVTSAELAIEQLKHTGAWEVNDKQHRGYCSVCNTQLLGFQNHTLVKKDNGDGTHTITCEKCTYEVTGEHVDENANHSCDACDISVHTLKAVDAVAVTCKADGLKAHFQCQTGTCKARFEDAEGAVSTSLTLMTIKKLEHKAVWQKTDETHKGVCEGCGEVFYGEMPHIFKYADKGDGTHIVTCEKCDYEKAVAHTDKNANCSCDYCDVEIHNLKAVEAKEVTCTADGLKAHYQCQNTGCKKRFEDAEAKKGTSLTLMTIKKLEHDYKTPVQTTVLNSAGKQQHGLQCECGAVLYRLCSFNDECVCSVCGTAMTHSDKSTMTYVAAKAPTCTEEGHTDYYECNVCGGTYLSDASEWDPTLEALGHDWEARKDTLNGQHLQKCKREGCGDYRTLNCDDTTGDCLCDINNCGKLIHSHKLVFHNPVAPTCEGKGAEGYFTYQDCDKKMFDMDMKEISAPVEIPAAGHTPSGEWTVNGEVHEELCAVCDKVLESAAHVDANYDNRCDDCDVALALELMPEKPATCTDIGYKACWVSPVTNRMYSDAEGRNHITSREVIPALGHQETGWVDQGGETHKMSCQRTGCTWSKVENHSGDNDCYCEVCGGYYEGHQLYEVEMVPATCTKAGTQAYYECECGKLYDLGYNPIKAPKAIAKLDHDYKDVKVQKDAKEGKHYVACNGCGNKVYENHTMVVNDPLKGNYHQYLCACGELEIETHYDKNGDKWCDVCGHGMGKTSVTVEQHNSQTVITGQSDKVNANKNWWWNWQEVFTPSNSGGSAATGNTEQNTTSSNGVPENNTANNGTVDNGNTNSGSTGNGGSNDSVVTPPAGSEGVDERAVTAPTVSQSNVLVQFINWFLGLFGF